MQNITPLRLKALWSIRPSPLSTLHSPLSKPQQRNKSSSVTREGGEGRVGVRVEGGFPPLIPVVMIIRDDLKKKKRKKIK